MPHTSTQQPSEAGRAVAATDPTRQLYTLRKFAERHASFLTLPALTNQIFKSRARHSSKGLIPGNGMLDLGVIVRIGTRVLVDEPAYFRWLDAQQAERELPLREVTT